MKTLQDIVPLSIRELVAQVHAGEIAPHEIIEAYYSGIEHLEPQIHAWTALQVDQLKQQIAQLSHVKDLSTLPLAGIPVGVKDIMNTMDLPTSYGSPIYHGYQPQEDAEIVRRHRELGGIVMGKTVTTEFAFLNPGPTVNPASLNVGVTVTPGGSSSGSAAAVACAMVPLAFATQTAASITRPAAFCGVVGYKPTFGTLSVAGVRPLSPSLDTIGMMGLRVDDVAYAVGHLVGRELIEITTAPAVIGILESPYWTDISNDAKRVLEISQQMLIKKGLTVKPIHLGSLAERLTQAQETVMYYEMAQTFSHEYQQVKNELSPLLVNFIEKGLHINADLYQEALAVKEEGQHYMEDLFGTLDVLLAPSTKGEAPDGLDATGDPVMSRLWSLLGNPTCHLPIGYSVRKLPIGITVVGAFGQDKKLLSIAQGLEQVFSGNN